MDGGQGFKMTEEPYEKYRFYQSNDFTLLASRVNEWEKEGYKLHTFTVDTGLDMHYNAVMSLSSTVDLSNAVNMVNIDLDKNTVDGTPLIEKLKEDGWTVIANYAKHVTMVKNAD